MARYARFNPSIPQPAPVIGWYDTDIFTYPHLPRKSELLEITDDEVWQTRRQTPKFVYNGRLIEQPPEIKLDDVKAEQINGLRKACQQAIIAGFASDALGSTKFYPAQLTDQHNLQASVTTAMLPNCHDNWKTPLWVKDHHGNWSMVMHTREQLHIVAFDCRNHIALKQMRLAELTANVHSSASVEAVQAIAF
jgi:hypothetical protein